MNVAFCDVVLGGRGRCWILAEARPGAERESGAWPRRDADGGRPRTRTVSTDRQYGFDGEMFQDLSVCTWVVPPVENRLTPTLSGRAG